MKKRGLMKVNLPVVGKKPRYKRTTNLTEISLLASTITALCFSIGIPPSHLIPLHGSDSAGPRLAFNVLGTAR